jgi:thioredoxin-related protein
MRRFLFAFAALAVVVYSPLRADDKPAWRTDYDAARKEAIAKGLPVFLHIYSEGCIHCQRLDAGPFRNPAVVNLLNERFIPMRVEASRAPRLLEVLHVQMYPTMVIAGTDGNVVAFLEGYHDAKTLTEQLQRAVATQAADRPRSDTSSSKSSERGRRAKELLGQARDEFKAEKYAATLELCQTLETTYYDLEEGTQGAKLAAEIRSNPEKFALACEQLNERVAIMYAAAGDNWLKKGEKDLAAASYEKAVRTAPASAVAREAQLKLVNLVSKTQPGTTAPGK